MPAFSPSAQSQAIALLLSSLSLAVYAQDTIPTLESIEVRSAPGGISLQALPASATVLDGEAMREHQLQVNLSEGLAGVPGLQIKNRQNYAQDLQLSVRGYGARSTFGVRGVRLYVDNIPATMPDGQGSLSHVDIGSIERVEVLRGPYSALYGNSSGGVVSIFTETPEGAPFVEGGVAFGSNGQKRFSAKAGGETEGGLSYLVSGSRFLTDGYRDHSAADRNTGNVKLSAAVGDDARWTLVANTMKSYAQDPQGLTWDQYQANPQQASSVAESFNTRKSLEQSQIGMTYERQLSGTHSIALMAYAGHRSMEQYQSIPLFGGPNPIQEQARHAGGVIDMSRDYAGVDARWTGKFSEAVIPVTVTAGLSIDHVKEDRKGYRNYQGSAAAPSAIGVKGELKRDEKNTITNIDPYVQATWKLSPTWTLDTGLRYSRVKFKNQDFYTAPANPNINNDKDNGDDSGSKTHRKALPVVSLSHALTPDDTVYASVGRGFETPTFAELSYSPGDVAGLNLDLQPSVSTQYELGYRQRLRGDVKGLWSAAVFHSSTSDEIVSAGAIGGRTTFRNAGKTRRQGVELQAALHLTPKWQVQAAYTYLDATFRQASGNAAAGNMLPGLSKQNMFVATSYQLTPEWKAGFSAQHASKLFANDANTAAAPAFTIASANLGYTTDIGAWRLHAFARVDNLFDRQYVGSVIVNDGNSRFYESAMGRNWSTGVNLRYNF